jgi:hypothetical protein
MKMKMRNFSSPRRINIYSSGRVVEISLQVGYCWLWSLIIFLIQRSLFSAMFIPHEYFTPHKNVHSSMWGIVGEVTPLVGFGGKWAHGEGLGDNVSRWEFKGEAPKGKISL